MGFHTAPGCSIAVSTLQQHDRRPKLECSACSAVQCSAPDACLVSKSGPQKAERSVPSVCQSGRKNWPHPLFNCRAARKKRHDTCPTVLTAKSADLGCLRACVYPLGSKQQRLSPPFAFAFAFVLCLLPCSMRACLACGLGIPEEAPTLEYAL